MTRIDGRQVRRQHTMVADVVVVGSGPAGAAVARTVSNTGARVVIVEAGPWIEPSSYAISSFGAMAGYYRNMGASVLLGDSPMPYIQGKMVGGTSAINGAICWRLPREVFDEWARADPAFAEAVPWSELEEVTDAIERDLNVLPTEPQIAGRKNHLMAVGAEALGLAHRPIRRNVRNCSGQGKCLQGCPQGNKLSMDRSYLVDAQARGAVIVSSVRAEKILYRRGKATGVQGRAAGGGRVIVHARHAVVLAASAVQTPALLLQSGINHGPVGRHFQCHPGVAVSGRFDQAVRMWEGATQGHEVTGMVAQGLKFEALGFGLAVVASRLQGLGRTLSTNIADMAHWINWGAAVRAQGRGRVWTLGRRIIVTFRPTKRDITLFRLGIQTIGQMMFAAGAGRVTPGIAGWDQEVTEPMRMQQLTYSAPVKASAYSAAVTHMFSTCHMGTRAADNVVRNDFRHHTMDRLYVADSSVFPTNTGVNPQIPIIAMATLCGRRVARS